MKKILIAGAALLFINVAHADMQEKTDQLCEKIKTCSIEQMGPDQPPAVIEMMQGMFDGMCASMMAPYMETYTDAGLENKAEACLDTILDASCDDLMANQGESYESAECQEFKAAADEAGIDVN